MSYIALARKWRPRTFSELLGQDHLTRALTQALKQNRIHHAYLFTGTRGVGKTSVARILAKALNCEQYVSAEPCLQCDACQAIEQGRFIDLIEIDAASKTRVEDTRELLDNVQYAPTVGRFKIYLIDEVHMLSQHSFNALLKTLEEPPAHVKFLLATTDVQKLPITILSRCLQFHLKHVPQAIIEAHLQTILQDEHIEADTQAVRMIAQAAQGSMRDALSLLDQTLAGRTDHLNAHEVAELLGQTTADYAIQLLYALTNHDPQQLVILSREIGQTGGHFRYVLEQLLSYLHRIAILQALPDAPQHLEADPQIFALAKQLAAEDTQLCYQIGIKGLQDLSLAPTMGIGFEMTLLRMYTFKPAPTAPIPKLVYEAPIKELAPLPEAPLVVEHLEKATVSMDWAEVVASLSLSGLALNALKQTELVAKTEQMVVLKAAKAHQSLFNAPVVKRIEGSLSTYYQEPVRIQLQYETTLLDSPAIQKKNADHKQQEQFSNALQKDAVFQQLQETFSAELVQDSVTGVDLGCDD